MAMLTSTLQGKFIVLDGPDGAGKSTQQRQLADRLQAAGVEIVCCRDPGGTEIGDRIRSVLLDYDLSTMNVDCESLLFMASRAQLIAEVIKPALASRKIVLCDRFVTSTCAYQGAAGYDPRRVIDLARFSIGDNWPDLTVIIDIDPDEGLARAGRRKLHAADDASISSGEAASIDGAGCDAMEARSIEFHRRVRDLFLAVHEYYPTPVVTVDGRGDVEAVHERVLEALAHVAG